MKTPPDSHFRPRSPSLAPLPSMEFEHPKFGSVTIEFDPNGQPVRHAITHGARTAAGSFPSLLMGRSMPWESFNERAVIHRLESERECKGYLVQPFVVRFMCNGIPQIYTPDAIAEFGRLKVIEAKASHMSAAGIAGEKYRVAARIFEWIGWDFEIWTGERLAKNGARLVNQNMLFRNRYVQFGLAHELTIREALMANGGVAMLRTLAEHLADALGLTLEHAEAAIWAMAARRIVHLNLDARITPVSLVELAASPAESMAILNFWEKADG